MNQSISQAIFISATGQPYAETTKLNRMKLKPGLPVWGLFTPTRQEVDRAYSKASGTRTVTCPFPPPPPPRLLLNVNFLMLHVVIGPLCMFIFSASL